LAQFTPPSSAKNRFEFVIALLPHLDEMVKAETMHYSKLLPSPEDMKGLNIDEMEHDLLYGDEMPKTLGIDSFTFMLAYLVVSSCANIYIAVNNMNDPTVYFYGLNVLFGLLGIYGLGKEKRMVWLLYAGFFLASFLFASFVAGGATLLMMNKDVCSKLSQLIPESSMIADMCMTDWGRAKLRVTVIGVFLAELALELFVLNQISKLYKWISRNENKEIKGDEKALLKLWNGRGGSMVLP